MLTAAPALHSLIVCDRQDAAHILKLLIDKNVELRKLLIKRCWLGEDSTGLLTNTVKLYPDLEVLSLESCHPPPSASYCLIPNLKKLSELKLSYCQVHYVYVKLLETHIMQCDSNIMQCYSNIMYCYNNIMQCYNNIMHCYNNTMHCYNNLIQCYNNTCSVTITQCSVTVI